MFRYVCLFACFAFFVVLAMVCSGEIFGNIHHSHLRNNVTTTIIPTNSPTFNPTFNPYYNISLDTLTESIATIAPINLTTTTNATTNKQSLSLVEPTFYPSIIHLFIHQI